MKNFPPHFLCRASKPAHGLRRTSLEVKQAWILRWLGSRTQAEFRELRKGELAMHSLKKRKQESWERRQNHWFTLWENLFPDMVQCQRLQRNLSSGQGIPTFLWGQGSHREGNSWVMYLLYSWHLLTANCKLPMEPRATRSWI